MCPVGRSVHGRRLRSSLSVIKRSEIKHAAMIIFSSDSESVIMTTRSHDFFGFYHVTDATNILFCAFFDNEVLKARNTDSKLPRGGG